MREPLDAVASEERAVNWQRAILAGLVATLAITISLALFGMNIVGMLGSMMLPGAGVAMQYIVGTMFHLMVGLTFAISYAALFSRVRPWGLPVKALVFGVAITAVALVAMPVMAAVMGGSKAGQGSPANPCAQKSSQSSANSSESAANPCASKPSNPCAQKASNPRAEKVPPQLANPCATKAPTANACSASRNPCNPCGGGSPYAGLISLVNHVIFAFVLAGVYGRGR